MTDVRWSQFRKSTRSNETNCVEVALSNQGGARVRDSKLDDSPVLEFGPDVWSAFCADVAAGNWAASSAP